MVAEDEGVLDSLQTGVKEGAAFGAIVATSRAFLNSTEFYNAAAKKLADAKAANPALSRSALRAMAPTPIPGMVMTTAAFAGMGGVYRASTTLLKDMRDKDDVWNRPIAGGIAGAFAGLRNQSIRVSAGCSAALFFSTMFLELTGGDLNRTSVSVSNDRKVLYAE